MQYYILMPSDGEADASNEANLLGEESFENFWPGQGLGLLMNLVQNNPEALHAVTIKTDMDPHTNIGVSEFIDRVSKLKIQRQ